jgi:hypothetical protein
MKAQIKACISKANKLKDRVKELIHDLPDAHPAATVLGTRCCTMHLKDLGSGNILSPRYYLTAGTKQALLALVDNVPLENLDACITKIINRKQLPDGEKISPEFAKELQELWSDQ